MRFLVVFFVFLISCSGSTDQKSKVDIYSEKGILLLGNGTEPSGIDPHLVTGVPEHKILLALLEGLVVFNPKNNGVLPGVAEDWSVSDDGLSYSFIFNPDAKWTNGDSVKPEHFAYSWERILSPDLGAQYADMLYVIKNAEKFHKGDIKDFSKVGISITKNKLKVELENPTPYFLNILTHYSTWPVHPETVEKYGGMISRNNQWTRVDNFVGNGPFKLESWEINKALRVSRNELYWGNSANKINGIEFIPIDNELTQDRLFRSGGIHLSNTVPTEKINRYRDERPDELNEHNYFGTYYYRINTNKYPLNNINFRKALSLAIDRELIVKSILKGNQKISYSFTPPDENGYNPKTNLDFNPIKAKEFLEESGYDINNPPLEILYNTSEGHQKIAQAIQEMWKKNLGLNVVLTNVDWKVYLTRETQGEFDISRAGWIGDYPDPFTFLDMMVTNRGNNKTGWSNSEFDNILKNAASQISTSDRYNLYEKAERILIDELPVIPLYTYTRTYLLSQRVKNWQNNILDTNPYQFLSLE
jgi:oligopeptide transport system substrate-binding protein